MNPLWIATLASLMHLASVFASLRHGMTTDSSITINSEITLTDHYLSLSIFLKDISDREGLSLWPRSQEVQPVLAEETSNRPSIPLRGQDLVLKPLTPSKF